MTNLITLTIPNDDHIALRAFGKALEEMALAHGAESKQHRIWVDQQFNIHPSAEAALAADRVKAPEEYPVEIDTTAQQLESFARNQQPLGNEIESVIKENLHELYLSDTGPVADSTCIPWDERIHSASKALNADGTWRLRRKPKDMDDAEWSDYVSMIKADLQYPAECGGEEEESAGGDLEENEQISNENNNIAPAEIDPPVTPPGDDYHTDAGVVTEQTVAGIPPIPVPPPVVVPPAQVDDAWTFPKLMTFLTERQGKIDVATVNMLLAQDGIASLPELNAHPDKIGPFVARVKAHLGE